MSIIVDLWHYEEVKMGANTVGVNVILSMNEPGFSDIKTFVGAYKLDVEYAKLITVGKDPQELVPEWIEKAKAGELGFHVHSFRIPDWHSLPNPCMIDGLQSWWKRGQLPGGFLQALIAGDLYRCMRRADGTNQRVILDMARWINKNFAPEMFGNRDALVKWPGVTARMLGVMDVERKGGIEL